jgi:iron complex outermembrane receptor protein
MASKSLRARIALFGGAAIAATAAWPTFAAEAAAAEKAGTKVEEVVVTTRRSSEKLQDVAIAVTAVTAAQIEAQKPRTLLDFAGEAPNVLIGLNTAGSGASAIFIRGLGYSDIEKGQNPVVGLLIDDVVIGTSTAQLIDAFDIIQVEIDRGPQGIFYGKNTTGGAISVHRSRPTHRWGLSLDAAIGDYGQHQGRIIANAPVGSTAGLKIGYSFRERGGYDYNVYTKKPYGRDALATANIEFDWKPTPSLDILASADFTHEYGEGTPVSLGDPAFAALNKTEYAAGHNFLGVPVLFNETGSPYIPGVTVPLGVHQTASDFPDRNQLSQQRYSLNVVWDTPYGQLTSITAFIKQNDATDQNFDGSCFAYNAPAGAAPCNVIGNPALGGLYLHTSRPQKYDQFTEELRFSHDFGTRAKLMVGAYYFHHDIEAVQLTRLGLPFLAYNQVWTNQISGESNHSVSVFGNFDLNVTDKLKLSAGIRYIDEATAYHNAYNNLFFHTSLIDVHDHASWSRPITRFGVEYKVTNENLLYFTVSEGFRSGGFSPRGTLSESQPTSTNYSPGADYLSFNPETDRAYELGSKNRFFQNQLTLNLAGFYTEDYGSQAGSVVQTGSYGPGTNTYIVNLPKITIYGVELESSLRPEAVPGLTLAFSGGYEHGTPPSGTLPGIFFPIGPGGQAGAPGSIYPVVAGAFANAPPWNFQISGDYNHEFGPGLIDFNIRYHWTDKYIIGGLGAPYYDYENAYGLLDASISYAWKNYKLTVSGKNLGDTVYLSNTLAAVDFQGWGAPRTFLVELQAKF